MADGLVIHKSDGDNLDLAKKAKSNYQSALHLFPQSEKNWSPKVLLASSMTGMGLEKVWDLIVEYEQKMKDSTFWDSNRATQRVNWLEDQIQDMLGQAFLRNEIVKNMLEADKPKVKFGELYPGVLAQRLINLFLT